MAETTRDTKSLVDDFNDQHGAPPRYEQLPQYDQTPGFHHGPTVSSQNMVVVTQPAMVVPVEHEPHPQVTGYVALSCFVFWCCCWPLGLAAFIFAIMATSDVNAHVARGHLKVSSMLSTMGMVAGLILICILVVYYVVFAPDEQKHQADGSHSQESMNDFDDVY